MLRKTIGTIGTPAWIARWNPPLRNRPSARVVDRVPSGKISSDVPPRIRFTKASSVARDWAELLRSMYAGSMSRLPTRLRGSKRASCLATMVNSPGMIVAATSGSTEL